MTEEALVSYGKLPLGRAKRLVRSLTAASAEATLAFVLSSVTSSSLCTAAGLCKHARCYHCQGAEHPAFAMNPVQDPLCRIVDARQAGKLLHDLVSRCLGTAKVTLGHAGAKVLLRVACAATALA